jgi:hypothetical protein
MTKNVTLKLDEALLREARHHAVDEGLSLSAWLTVQLQALVGEADDLARARSHALAAMKKGFALGGGKFRREELYDRG